MTLYYGSDMADIRVRSYQNVEKCVSVDLRLFIVMKQVTGTVRYTECGGRFWAA